MNQGKTTTFTAFEGHKLIKRGELIDVVTQTKRRLDDGENGRIAIFMDTTGEAIDFDFRGSVFEVIGRLGEHPIFTKEDRQTQSTASPAPRRPGRPKLGVVSREISLLPRHWDWLRLQKGGASATLRRLVDEARKTDQGNDSTQKGIEAIHRFMWDIAGDFPNFEEASRAFFKQDLQSFRKCIVDWPADIKQHIDDLIQELLPPIPQSPSDRQ